MEPDDEKLLRAFASGDASSFEVFYRRHKQRVYSFCFRMLLDQRLAEDALQETFLRVIRAAPSWKPEAKPTTWLFQIARNYCVDLLRKRKQQENFLKTRSLELLGDDVDLVSTNPERELARGKLRSSLLAALAQLPEAQREVFLLREVSGLKFQEIAEVVGISENTAKSRMRYALSALQEHLQGTYAEFGEKGGAK